jgi:hypothetical protein
MEGNIKETVEVSQEKFAGLKADRPRKNQQGRQWSALIVVVSDHKKMVHLRYGLLSFKFL